VTRQLIDNELDANPFVQFAKWYDEARKAEQDWPEGVTLSTAAMDGVVSSRVVLLKGFDQRGFVFFTNYGSHKGAQIHENPNAALNWWWPALERQVRAEGAIVKTAAEESDAYWVTRPRGSQLGAWASDQSRVILGRGDLEARFHELEETYRDVPVPRPPHWGGFRVIPNVVEFWQGRQERLHDRFVYRLRESKDWVIERLAP
jgi:pyridoxamine 5'-phosphate oxidase